jgi:cytochrome c-type biogenesis protein CcmH
MRIILVLLVLLIAVPVQPALAVQPDEMLADPVLEARARELSKELRCLVCRNESIDDSNAGLARDLRLLVRERLVAGDSDTQVLSYLVERYGEFVLLKPQFSIANAALWLAGPAFFLFGLIVIAAYLRTRRPQTVDGTAADGAATNEAPLSDDEKRQLDDILNG